MCSLGHFMDYAMSDYSQAVLHAGGAPVIIPAAQDSGSLSHKTVTCQARSWKIGASVHRFFSADSV
jgi:hypothetical protein